MIDQIIGDITTAFFARWKFFLICILAVYWFTSMQILGFNFHSVFPKSQKVEYAASQNIERIRNLLQQKANDFKLIKPFGLIPITRAVSVFDRASAYIVVDLGGGEVLAEKDSFLRLPIASLTKVMSAVVLLDLSNPKDEFEVSQKAVLTDPTKIGVAAGQKMKLEELLPAVLMTSANDAAEVIKEGIDKNYGDGGFVKAMNYKAEFLGLQNTHFENAQGFDNENNYSSAEDLAILANYALENYPIIADIARQDYRFLPADSNHKQFDLYNWNGLLGVYPGVKGLKIGYTDDAKHTTIVVAEREEKKILVVLLGAPSVIERDLWVSQLLDLGFNKSVGLSSVSITKDQLKQKYSTFKYWH